MIFLKTKAGFSYYLDVECSISVYFSLETSDLMIWQNFPSFDGVCSVYAQLVFMCAAEPDFSAAQSNQNFHVLKFHTAAEGQSCNHWLPLAVLFPCDSGEMDCIGAKRCLFLSFSETETCKIASLDAFSLNKRSLC